MICVDPSTDVIKRYSVSGRADKQDGTPFGEIDEADRLGQKIEFVKLLNLVNETFITIISGAFEGVNLADRV